MANKMYSPGLENPWMSLRKACQHSLVYVALWGRVCVRSFEGSVVMANADWPWQVCSERKVPVSLGPWPYWVWSRYVLTSSVGQADGHVAPLTDFTVCLGLELSGPSGWSWQGYDLRLDFDMSSHLLLLIYIGMSQKR